MSLTMAEVLRDAWKLCLYDATIKREICNALNFNTNVTIMLVYTIYDEETGSNKIQILQ